MQGQRPSLFHSFCAVWRKETHTLLFSACGLITSFISKELIYLLHTSGHVMYKLYYTLREAQYSANKLRARHPAPTCWLSLSLSPPYWCNKGAITFISAPRARWPPFKKAKFILSVGNLGALKRPRDLAGNLITLFYFAIWWAPLEISYKSGI